MSSKWKCSIQTMKENLQENGWEGLYYVSWLSLKNIKITSYISYFDTFNVSVYLMY